MKVLIRDDETRLFLASCGLWTDNARDARDFAMTIHAQSVAQRLNLRKFSVQFYFPDLDYKIVVCEF